MKKGNSNNFFQRIMDTIFGSNDPEAAKRKQLRLISKSLGKTKYSKFYKFQGNEALPPMGKFFFELYKTIYPAQTMFQNLPSPNLLKTLAINYYTTDEIREIEESLSEENLMKLAKQIPISHIEEETEKRLAKYSEFFTLEKINQIENLYRQLSTLKDFCVFDFYFLVKKFNKGMKEADFATMPNFEKINAEYISGEIRDFISVAWNISTESDWSDCIKLLRAHKGVEPITLQNWKRILARLSSLKSSGALELIVKLSEGNPNLICEVNEVGQSIVEPFLEKIKSSAEAVLHKLAADEKANKAGNICAQLFPDIDVVPLRNYSENWNTTFRNKKLATFNNAEAMKYLKTFLLEIFKKDIREYYDLFLVRGQWNTQALSGPFSESYNWILSCTDKILSFDAELAEDAPIGIRIKTLLPKTDRDSSSKNIANRLINDANKTAYKFLVGCTRNLISMGKIIKSLVDDYAKNQPEIIANWKELEKFADKPIKEFSVELYKKIYLFTTLIQTSITNMEEEEE